MNTDINNVFQYRMPAGIPGHVTRIQASIIEAAVASLRYPPTEYGVPMALDTQGWMVPTLDPGGRIRPIGAGRKGSPPDKAEDVRGFLVRPYPTQQAGDGTPITGLCNLLVRGYISVRVRGETASRKYGAVYARVDQPTNDKPLGGIEAAPDEDNTIELIDTHFMGDADANGNVEIAYRI